MSDWDEFRLDVQWFAAPPTKVDVGPAVPAADVLDVSDSAFADAFPDLAGLLTTARLTPLKVNPRRGGPQEFHLLSWPRDVSRFGWLCPVSPVGVTRQLHRDHELLLEAFGGIGERFNEPDDTWLLNLNEALTAGVAIEPTEPAWLDADGEGQHTRRGDRAAVELDEHYPIAIEANGNTTLCHQTTGDVLLYAPDHSFTHVRPLEGWPEYTFYRIPAAPTFRDWVEAVARQWSRHVRPDPPS